MLLFSIATVTPLVLLALGAGLGGGWILAALVWMTALTALLDALVARTPAPALAEEFPAADGLSVVLALGHIAVLALVLRAIGQPDFTGWEKAGLFIGFGLYAGQVSNSNAHELIHRGARGLRRLGVLVYILNLYGHHNSAHLLVHHRHVATDQDPNTARLGESFYHFAGRAWRGSFRAGLRAETERLHQAGRPRWRNPYLVYGAGTGLAFVAASLIGGAPAALCLFGLGIFATLQILMSDYVQHYGLWRDTGPSGKPEPATERHSWNAPHWFSAGLMLNAPRHSDHHAHPSRPYPSLRLDPAMPILPRSLPVMACLALWPRQWKRVMDPLVRAVRGAA